MQANNWGPRSWNESHMQWTANADQKPRSIAGGPPTEIAPTATCLA